jgi:glutamate-1-semialdehyde 2,1-aminomutase
MAKISGGGFPMGAVGGRAEVMSVFEKPGPQYVAHLGTFSANPVSLTAGLAALELLDEKAIDRLNSLGARARVGIEKVIKDRSLPACVTGLGSMFQVHWTRGPVREARHAESAVSELKILTFLGLSNRGIQTSMRGMCSLSTPMSEEHIDTLVSAFADTVADLEAEGWLNR